MKRIIIKEREVAFRTINKGYEPIQLSRENILFRNTVKSKKAIPSMDLFIVPWQQFGE